jgi:polysaccharide deacetylase family protein (PEP-CTERM system associated)
MLWVNGVPTDKSAAADNRSSHQANSVVSTVRYSSQDMPETHSTAPARAAAPLNAFTVDVEDYFHVAALSSAIARDSWATRELRVEANTDRLLGILEERRTRATFFVLGWVAERTPSLVRRIAAAGHEVACHGYSHKLVYTQTPAEFREETVRAKGYLEDTLGHSVLGYRAASFSVTRQSLWALDVLIDLGFRYDSSIFPIHHDLYGIPGATPEPHRVTAPSGRTLAEFPMSAASFFGLRVPVSGGGYFRILPYWLTRAGLKQINEHRKRPFAFYLHPWELDPGQPRIKVGAFSRFRHYTNLSRCEARLRRVLGDFAFTSMQEALQQRGLLGEAASATRLRPLLGPALEQQPLSAG